MGTVLTVTPFRLWLLWPALALGVAAQLDLLRHAAQELSEGVRCHVPEAFPLWRRQGDHHSLIHPRDFPGHEVARELLIDLVRSVNGPQHPLDRALHVVRR